MIRNMAVITWPGPSSLKQLKLPLYAVDNPLDFYRKIPKQYDGIILADNSVVFDNWNSIRRMIAEKLDEYPIIQPFSEAHHPTEGECISYGKYINMFNNPNNKPVIDIGINIGLIWAIRCDMLTYELFKILVSCLESKKYGNELFKFSDRIGYIDSTISHNTKTIICDKNEIKQKATITYNKMAILSCYFNPYKYKNSKNNLYRFISDLGEHVEDLFIAELSYDDDEPELKEPFVRHYRGRRADQLLWQKERLINSLIENLPPEYDSFAWVDADIIFLRNDWYKKTLEQLDDYKIVQMYSKSHWIDGDGSIVLSRQSCGYAACHNEKQYLQLNISHPGYCWAARRDIGFELYEENITGGGDTVMLSGFNKQENKLWWKFNDEWDRHIDKWIDKTHNIVGNSIGYVPCDIAHLYHGTRENRRYISRWVLLSNYNFDPETDLYIDNDLLTFTDHVINTKPSMIKSIENFFINRREDT